MIVGNQRKRLERYARAAANAGVQFVASRASQLYKEAVRAKTHDTFPVGPFDPPHSVPGEFPDRETGQGHDSIDWEANEGQLAAAFGVRGPTTGEGPRGDHQQAGGMHLIWLTAKGRKGPEDIVSENRKELEAAFKLGVRSVKP